jgi:hypothetical protein
MIITCADLKHEFRSHLAGWSSKLGTSSVPVSGMICEACAKARKLEAAINVGSLEVTIQITMSGDTLVIAPVEYATGEVIHRKEYQTTLIGLLGAPLATSFNATVLGWLRNR